MPFTGDFTSAFTTLWGSIQPSDVVPKAQKFADDVHKVLDAGFTTISAVTAIAGTVVAPPAPYAGVEDVAPLTFTNTASTIIAPIHSGWGSNGDLITTAISDSGYMADAIFEMTSSVEISYSIHNGAPVLVPAPVEALKSLLLPHYVLAYSPPGIPPSTKASVLSAGIVASINSWIITNLIVGTADNGPPGPIVATITGNLI